MSVLTLEEAAQLVISAKRGVTRFLPIPVHNAIIELEESLIDVTETKHHIVRQDIKEPAC